MRGSRSRLATLLTPLVFASFAVACSDDRPATTVVHDTALRETAESLQYDLVERAGASLEPFDFEWMMETTQLDETGDTLAHEQFRIARRDGVWQVRDSLIAGSFSEGWIARFFGQSRPRRPDSARYAAIIPRNPPYLDARTRDAYRLRQVKSNGTTDVIVDLVDEKGVDSDLRYARFAYDPASRHVVAISIERAEDGLLNDARTRSDLNLVKVDSTWLPSEFVFDQTRRGPLQSVYHLVRREHFSAFVRR